MAAFYRNAIAAGNCHSGSWFDFTGALRDAYAILASLLLTLTTPAFKYLRIEYECSTVT